MSTNSLESFFRYYDGKPHQQKAVEMLEAAIPPELLDDDAEWVVQYRDAPDAPARLTPNSPFSHLVTPNFSYAEWTNGGEEARRFVNQGQCDIAIEISEFLEQARAKFGPLKITSGHRPPAINAAVGGASNSEHLFQPGCGAVDCYPINGFGQEFESWCDREWPYSIGYGMAYRGFVHIGIRAGRPRVRWDY